MNKIENQHPWTTCPFNAHSQKPPAKSYRKSSPSQKSTAESGQPTGKKISMSCSAPSPFSIFSTPLHQNLSLTSSTNTLLKKLPPTDSINLFKEKNKAQKFQYPLQLSHWTPNKKNFIYSPALECGQWIPKPFSPTSKV